MGNEVFIRREPIINRHKAIIATRLIVHADSPAAAAATLQQLGDVWPNVHSAMVALEGCTPTLDLLAWSPPLNAMIEIPAHALAAPETLALVERLHRDGVALSLSHYHPGTTLPDAPFRFLLADFSAHTCLEDPPALPLARHLADPEMFETAIAHGYAGAAGWFFLHGAPAAGPGTSHAQIVLNLVRKNAEVACRGCPQARHHHLYKLLRYINCPPRPGQGNQSFRHAAPCSATTSSTSGYPCCWSLPARTRLPLP
jgi:EAL and modified HD-GYP domain-containing signal transduction protein